MTGNPGAAPLSSGRRYLILAICCLSLFVVGLDTTIVNVALPSIGRDLHAGVSGLQWVIDAYILVLASLLMLSGSTADRVGRRRTFQAGLAIFGAGSLLCSVAPGLGWLVGFRMVQAIGGSMLNPVALSIITNVFIAPRERARAIGVWGGVFGLSMALGPVLGGVLTQTTGWRGIFWVNVPVVIAAIVLTAVYVPESRAPHARRPDPAGQLLVVVLLAGLVYGFIEGPGRGWSSPVILACFAAAAAALAALIAYERRRDEPLIDLRFFRSRPFSGAVAIAVCAFAALGGFLLVNTLYLQDVRHLSPLAAGLYVLPMALMTVVCGPASGAAVAKFGARPSLVISGVFIVVAGLLLTRLAATTPAALLIVTYLLFGIGFGAVNPPLTNSAVSGMPRSQAGVAAAVTSTSRQVGSSLGVAIIGSAAVSALHGSVGAGLAQASHAGWWILAGCGAAVLILGLVTSGPGAQASAARVARLFPEHDAPASSGDDLQSARRD